MISPIKIGYYPTQFSKNNDLIYIKSHAKSCMLTSKSNDFTN